MAFREVSVGEVHEVLRAWVGGAGLRTVAGRAGVDRKTARRYVAAAEAAGVVRDGDETQLTEEVIGQVVAAVRPVRPGGHGQAWEALEAQREQISEWVGKDLTVVKIADLLTRRGVLVPYRTLHRFCTEECGFGGGDRTTVRVADGEPGAECQLDFARMGPIYDPGAGRRRVAHALIFTAVCSRQVFVWLSFSQTLAAVIAGCEAAWRFFGGVFRVLIPDNLSPVVADADPVNPRFTVGWLDYAQHAGFATDPARVRSPKDKPRVERSVQYVRGNFFAGEEFVDLADAQARAERWCREVAGARIHGTTAARPAEVFAEREASALLAVPEAYDVPIFTRVKVHRDFHIEIGKALYSAPQAYLGQHLDVRADSALVKLFHRGQLVKVHPRQRPCGRVSDPQDLPRAQDRLRLTGSRSSPSQRGPARPRGGYLRRAAAGRSAALDQDAPALPAARADPPLRRGRGQHRLRPGTRPRRHRCHQDRLHAGAGHGEHPSTTANTAEPWRGPVRPRPRRVPSAPPGAHPGPRRRRSAVMTTTELLEALRAHLSDFELPQPNSVHLTPSLHTEPVTAQLPRHAPAHTGSALLAWADTLTHVTAEAWRVPSGETVHLSVTGRLPGGTPIRIYTGVVFTEHGIGAQLAPGAATTLPLATLRSPLPPRQVSS
jgi:transposase